MAILTEKQTRGRKPSPKRQRERLTADQQANVRRSLHALGVRMGSTERLADAMGVTRLALEKARSPGRPQSPRLALVVARLAGVGVDDVITGRWMVVCPVCGWNRKTLLVARRLEQLAPRPLRRLEPCGYCDAIDRRALGGRKTH